MNGGEKMNTHETTMMLSGMILNNTENEIPTPNMQMSTRPAIDNVVCHYLDGEALKNALFIIDNIREHDMKIKWSSVNKWAVKYRSRHVCYLSIENGFLVIGQVSDILAKRVKYMAYDLENMKRLVDVFRNSMPEAQETYALT